METIRTDDPRWRGLLSQKSGQVGEDVAHQALVDLGFKMVEKIHTGWRLIRWVNRKRGFAHVVPNAKVSGDRHAIYPVTGQRVLAEVKTFDAKTLAWSRLETHQHDSLRDNAAYGGISLLVWVNYGQPLVMDYSKLLAAGFGDVVTQKGANKRRRSINIAMSQNCLWHPPSGG